MNAIEWFKNTNLVSFFIDWKNHNKEFFQIRARNKSYRDIVKNSRRVEEKTEEPLFDLSFKKNKLPTEKKITKIKIENNVLEFCHDKEENKIFLPEEVCGNKKTKKVTKSKNKKKKINNWTIENLKQDFENEFKRTI